jgi:hypothetical protein
MCSLGRAREFPKLVQKQLKKAEKGVFRDVRERWLE